MGIFAQSIASIANMVLGFLPPELNLFRLTGDALHTCGIISMCTGLLKYSQWPQTAVSLRSLELYALVYVTRYLDLLRWVERRLWEWPALQVYNNMMKVIFISITLKSVHTMRRGHLHPSFDPAKDPVRGYAPIAISVFFTVFVPLHKIPDIFELAWTFSIYLEALAILPQVLLLVKIRAIPRFVVLYIVSLGLYRAMYVYNWIVRYLQQGAEYVQKDDNVVIWTCGGIQVALFTAALLYVIAYRTSPATSEQLLDKLPLLPK